MGWLQSWHCYPDRKRVDSVQCCSGRLGHDLSLADCFKGGTQPQVVEVVGCVWYGWWIWWWVMLMMTISILRRVWLVVLLGASISVIVNSACAGFLSGVIFYTHHCQIFYMASFIFNLIKFQWYKCLQYKNPGALLHHDRSGCEWKSEGERPRRIWVRFLLQ